MLVAVIVGVLAQFHEFRGIFLKHVEDVLVQEDFMKGLTEKRLGIISRKAYLAKVSRVVTNPAHKSEAMYESVSMSVFPLFEQQYRENYRELMNLDFLTLAQLLQQKALPAANAQNADLKVSIAKTVTLFDVIAPTMTSADFEFQYEDQLEAVPGLPPDEHLKLDLYVNGVKQKVVLQFATPSPTEITVVADPLRVPFMGGKCEVRLESEEVEANPHMQSITMVMLTKNFEVHAVSSDKSVTLHILVSAMGGSTTGPTTRGNTIDIWHTGWVLPGHSVLVYW